MTVHFRVVCPSSSIPYVTPPERELAAQRFRHHGCELSFGRYIDLVEAGGRAGLAKRLEDFHAAFLDPAVTHVLCGAGGFHLFEILDHLDWDLIRRHPKPVYGFSDITILQNALFATCRIKTYSAPNYGAFGMKLGFEYLDESFFATLRDPVIRYRASESYSNDEWYFDQDNRHFTPNEGPQVIVPGGAKGVVLGGNVSSLALMQGTKYMPDLTGSLLLVEEDATCGDLTLDIFVRQLRSILYTSGAPAALLVGRFQSKSEISLAELAECLSREFGPLGIPVVAHLDFGHSQPMFSFPLGREGILQADKDRSFSLSIDNG